MALSFYVTLALFAAAPVTEQIIEPSAGGGGAGYAWWRIDSERVAGSKWYRLLAGRESTVWLNGVRLTAAEPGAFDVSSLKPRNLVVVRPAAPVQLSITPRVFISWQEALRNGDSIRVRVTIRNTLENTVNCAVLIRGEEQLAGIPATVPPGVSQSVELSFPDAPSRSASGLGLHLEKDEEAMEGSYRFEVRLRLPR